MAGARGLAPVREFPAGASPYPYPQVMDILTDPAKIPADPAQIPGDCLIGTEVWAALQGVEMSTFYSQRTRSTAHRRHDAQQPQEPSQVRPGDMPEADEKSGNAPLWRMRTYRAWEEQRPGKASSLGKAGGPGSRGGQGAGKVVRLPVQCPHCHHEITGAQLAAAAEQEAGKRAEFARLREEKVPVTEAAAQLGIGEGTARSWEMARRRAGRSTLPEAVERRPEGRRRAVGA
jgi:hypothetical protein